MAGSFCTSELAVDSEKPSDTNHQWLRTKVMSSITFPGFCVKSSFCVAFRIAGHPGTRPYEFMAINAHLYYGNYIDDRRQEFNALVDWIIHRLKTERHAYFPNFILMGDLNLD